MILIKRKIIIVSMNLYCFKRAFSRISQNPKQTKTFPKPILSKPKPNQNWHQNYQNHVKTILSKPKPHQNQDFNTKTSKLVLVLVHAYWKLLLITIDDLCIFLQGLFMVLSLKKRYQQIGMFFFNLLFFCT